MATLKIQEVSKLTVGTPASHLQSLIVVAVAKANANAARWNEQPVKWTEDDTRDLLAGVSYSDCYEFKGWIPESLKGAKICEYTIEVPELLARKVRAINKLEGGLHLVRRFETADRP